MSAPLLATKLYTPRARGSSVVRTRLTQLLEAGAGSKLLLLSAPAGFGKTTLLAQWLDARALSTTVPNRKGTGVNGSTRHPLAWVSLDAEDNDPTVFWAYLVTALRTALLEDAPEVGASELQLLRAPNPPPVNRLLTTLLNDLGAVGLDIVLVLDDYHVIETREVHDGITFLLDHLPPNVQVVMASRADPPLPLARLRARGELTEIRIADLRFTASEVTAYLNGPMGLTLSPTQLAALGERTEGWIAALQLVALSLQGRKDVAGFIGEFAGDDRYIVDYLLEEVLQRQPAHVEAFLLQTSVLDRLTGPLCDAVTAREGGRARLESLDRANLFVVPLDDHRRWYRYHQLFSDVLRARLLDQQPDQVAILHQRACEWYERHGHRADAIHHAVAAEDYDRAADLTERSIPAARRDRREAALRGWLEQLPDEVVRVRPVLCLAYAGALLSTGTVAGVEQHLACAEQWLAHRENNAGTGARPTARSHRMVVVDEELYRRLPGWLALYRAAHALMINDTPAASASARHALELLEGDDDIGHAAGSALLGLTSWAAGDLDSAHIAYTRCQLLFHKAGYRTDVLGCATTLADIRVTQGRLDDAMSTYEAALRLAADFSRGVGPIADHVSTSGKPANAPGGPNGPASTVLRGTADMYVGMSELHCERNDTATAIRLLEESLGFGEHAGLPRCRYRWSLAMARVRQAEGDFRAATAHLDDAERHYDRDFAPPVRPIPAVRARMFVAQGLLPDALAWVRSRELSADDDLGYVLEFEHLTLARVLLATFVSEGKESGIADATRLLDRLLPAAEDGGRTGTLIEVLLLQALRHHHHGDDSAALRPLERALALAEPQGYTRVFLDEGPPMVELLTAAADAGMAVDYCRALLSHAARDTAVPGRGSAQTAAASAMPSPIGSGGRDDDELLLEPLSERERDVLRLLRTDLGGPEIARELVLSLNTVRTHTKNIYAKLGVNNRRAAVRRAHELDLLHGWRRNQ